jgi:gluconokinase
MLLIDDGVRLVYLKGDYGLIRERLNARSDHYMNPVLLDSQFATLEEPGGALQIDVQLPPKTIVEKIRSEFNI